MDTFGSNYMSYSFGGIDTLKYDITPHTLPLIVFKPLNEVILPNG